jgi:hypothetical protein
MRHIALDSHSVLSTTLYNMIPSILTIFLEYYHDAAKVTLTMIHFPAAFDQELDTTYRIFDADHAHDHVT